MGQHMRLARIEEELLKLAKTYDYRDVDFSTDNGGDVVALTITAFAPGDMSVGIPDAVDSFFYDLILQHDQTEVEMPTGYSVKLVGQKVPKGIVAIEDEDIALCARDLGNIAARMLFQEHYSR